MKKICIVVSSSLTVKAFLLKHIEVLLDSYDVTVVSSDEIDFVKEYGMVCKSKAIQINRKISLWNDLKSVVNLYNFFLSEKFDLALSVTPKAGLLCSIASFSAGVKKRMHVFTGQVWVTKSGLFKSVLKFMDTLIVRMTSFQLVDGVSQRNFLLSESIVHNSTSAVLIKNSLACVDMKKFKFSDKAKTALQEKYGITEENFVFIFIGRLNVDKGLLELNEVFLNLFQKYSSIKLFLVGPDEEAISRKISTLLSNQNVFRLDYLQNPEYILNLADVLILPSHREGFGAVVVEAASMGIPCIGSNIYGLQDTIIDNITGILHEKQNIGDMILKYEFAIANKVKLRELGFNAQNRVNKYFKCEILTDKFKKFIDEFMEKPL